MCKRMSWDYYTYLKQPQWFIETIKLIDSIDADFAEVQANKNKAKRNG